MQETPLITKIHQSVVWVHRDQTIPSIRLKVQADTETGPLVLWITTNAVKELAANLTHILQDKRFQ